MSKKRWDIERFLETVERAFFGQNIANILLSGSAGHYNICGLRTQSFQHPEDLHSVVLPVEAQFNERYLEIVFPGEVRRLVPILGQANRMALERKKTF